MKHSIIYIRLHTATGVVPVGLNVFTDGDPRVVAKAHLRVLLGVAKTRKENG